MTADLTPVLKVCSLDQHAASDHLTWELGGRTDSQALPRLAESEAQGAGWGRGGAGPSQVVSQALQVVLMNLEVENHSPKLLRRLGSQG